MLLGLIKSVILKKNDTANSTEEGRPWHSSRASDSTVCHLLPSKETAGDMYSSVAHTGTCSGTAPLPHQDAEQTRMLAFTF